MTVTIKTTVHGETYEITGATSAEVASAVAELAANVDGILNHLIVVKQIGTAKNVLGGTTPVAVPASAPWTPPAAQAAPPAAPVQQGPPGSVAPSCPIHNAPMVYKSGNKNGKAWSAHFCQIKPCDTPPVWS